MIDIQKIKSYLLEICLNTSELTNESMENAGYIRSIPGLTYTLNKEDLQAFHKALIETRREIAVKKNFDKSYIKEKLHDIIAITLKEPEEKRPEVLEIELNNLKDKLKEKIKDYEFTFHIRDLFIKDELLIGKVKFFELKENEFKNLKEQLETDYSIMGNMMGLRSMLKTGETYACIKTRGVQDYAYSSALTSIRQAVNIIKFLMYPSESNFGLDGDIPLRENRQSIVKFESTDKHLRASLAHNINQCILDQKQIEIMENNGLAELNKILTQKKKLIDYENRLLTGIYWFGEAISIDIEKKEIISDDDRENPVENLEFITRCEKLFKLFTALESVLNFNKNEPVIQNISERSALLVNNNLDKRKLIRTKIKDLYTQRSDFTHKGIAYIPKEDLNYLATIVVSVLDRIIILRKENNINDQKELTKFIDDLKFS